MLFIVLILGFEDTLGIIEMLANGLIMLVGLLMKVSSPFDTPGGHRMLQVWVPLCRPAVLGQLHDKIQRPGYLTSRRAKILRSPGPLPC